MSAHQMIRHLGDAYRMAGGVRPAPRQDNLVSRTFVRRIALHTSMAWPKGVKTLPGADQERGGTRPVAWDMDHAELLRLVDGFQALDGHPHPIFGPLSAAEWNVWAFRHADHHLRRFAA